MLAGEWIDALERTDRGLILLTNLLHDCYENRVPPTLIRYFFSLVADDECGSPQEALNAAISAHSDELLCAGQPPLSNERCSRVMDAMDLLAFNLDKRKLPIAASQGYQPHGLVDFLEKFGVGGAAIGEMRTRLPIAWVTKKEALDSVRSTTEPTEVTAARVRELLGLKHVSGDQLLIEVIYPALIPAADELRPPTFLDGGNIIYFRCYRRSEDSWGQAIDLESGGPGLPEAVRRPVKFTVMFEVRRIGQISRDFAHLEYGAVWQNARYPWNATSAARNHILLLLE